jgi:protease I
MSKKALFVIPPTNFNEDELFYPMNALKEAGVEVKVTSTKVGEITGDNEGKAESVATFTQENLGDYDLVSVIGGSGTIDHLWNNQELLQLLKKAHEDKILVTGICAGAVVVAKTGLLKGRQGTCYPVDVMINELKANNVEYVETHVIEHSDIITSDGPMGAKDFGAALVKALQQ